MTALTLWWMRRKNFIFEIKTTNPGWSGDYILCICFQTKGSLLALMENVFNRHVCDRRLKRKLSFLSQERQPAQSSPWLSMIRVYYMIITVSQRCKCRHNPRYSSEGERWEKTPCSHPPTFIPLLFGCRAPLLWTHRTLQVSMILKV